MSEELVRDVFRFSVSAPRMTSHVLKTLLRAMFAEGRGLKQIIRDGKTGELKLNDLYKRGGEVTSIPVSVDNIGDFRRTAEKYHIDFALKEVKDSEGVTKEVVYFQAKNIDVMEKALEEYGKTMSEEKPTLDEYIDNAVREEADMAKERGGDEKERARSGRTRSRDRGDDPSVPPL